MFLLLFFTASCQTQSPKLCVEKADKLVAEQKENEAIILYQQCIQKDSKQPVYYLNQAALFMQQKRYDQAERAYGGVLNLSPNSYWPYIGLAKVYLVQENYDDAESVLKEGLESVDKGQKAPILLYLGKTAYVMGEGEPAVEYLTQALDEKISETQQVYYFRGLVFEELLKDNTKALQDYQAYLAANDADEARVAEVKGRVQKLTGEGEPRSE